MDEVISGRQSQEIGCNEEKGYVDELGLRASGTVSNMSVSMLA
jgi:hypothetical protein